MQAHQPSAGFTFWERGALNQFASQAAKALSRIIEITDNNSPASVMHDNPRRALEQIHCEALQLAVEAKAEAEASKTAYLVQWEQLGTKCVEVFADRGSAVEFSNWLVPNSSITSVSMRGAGFVAAVKAK